jgi:ATP-binding protein involved in chromosome partitioning
VKQAHKAAAVSQPARLPGVARIIAIASGKGGVGKSTVTVNLAAVCQSKGLRVGILDADIYGPSLGKMLHITQTPHLRADKKLDPIHERGLDLMSIGFIMGQDKAMLWRGPMVMGALQQMLLKVAWSNLDVLLIDLPPGTGDAQLTLVQNVVVDGAIIVSTPQDLALLDARRGLKMFQRVNVPILGIIENMSMFTCPGCGSHFEIFGHGGAESEARQLGVPFLGMLPLDPKIRAACDAGEIYVASHPGEEGAHAYLAVAEKLLSGPAFKVI